MLGDLLCVPVLDVMTPEVVAVPTRGIERWLQQQLAARLGAGDGRTDGVCANVEFPFPANLFGHAHAAVSDIDPDTDPWAPERSVWALLDVVTASLREPWLRQFATHLEKAAPEGEQRVFASVRHVADLYDRYSVHRPAMIRTWAGGADVQEADGGWQQALWRRLRERIGTPSPAERLPLVCEALRDGVDVPGLPERFSLFGLTRLPASYVDVLAALGAGHDVHLFLLHPSPEQWRKVAKALEPKDGSISGSGVTGTGGTRRRDDPTSELTKNPLLGSWGRDSREMQVVLATQAAGWADDHSGLDVQPVTLLERLQADVRSDRPPVGRPFAGAPDKRPLLSAHDTSVRVHSCHGRARQVDVLRNAVLHLFEDDPSLEPRDVLVMCPDIETYAPLIHATFDSQPGEVPDGGSGDGVTPERPDLHVRLADRAIRQVNPLLSVVSRLLALADSRVTATEVLDLAGCEPVKRRFGFDDDDLSRMQEWVVQSRVRWGIDAAHRARFLLGDLEANTWRSGIDRILLGVAMADERQRVFGGVVPLDDVGSSDIELAGRIAELLDRLEDVLDSFSGVHPVSEWAGSIWSAAETLTDAGRGEEWQRTELGRILNEIAADATSGGATCGVGLGLADVKVVLGDRLRGRPSRANFRTGHLTICTLYPMRSVPHRVVCLLGLDDGAFPRNPERDGDDLILAEPNVGDHDARSDDRQLMLDALLAATDHLVITYTGSDERSNLPRPPAVPVGELLDAIDATVRVDGGSDARERVVVKHPLQPFDKRNFTPGSLIEPGPWSFDEANLEGARVAAARVGEHVSSPRFLETVLDPVPDGPIELAELQKFLDSPAKAFLRQRLSVSTGDGGDEIDDVLPIELDGLRRWGVGESILKEVLDGGTIAGGIEAEVARGSLPPGMLSRSSLDDIEEGLQSLLDAGVDGGPSSSLAVNVDLSGGRRIVGTVPGLRNDVIYNVTYSRVAARHRLKAWVNLLTATATHPERDFSVLTIGRDEAGEHGERARVVRTGPLGGVPGDDPDPEKAAVARAHAARAHLELLVDLYLRGMCEPVPLYCQTSAAWAEAVVRGSGDAARAADRQWRSPFKDTGEDKKAEHLLVLGGQVPFDALCEAPPEPQESGDGWNRAEPTRFGRWALTLWAPILAHEETT